MTTYDYFTAEGLSAALAALGDTPEAVADALLAAGHTGKPGCDTSCPVAEYLLACFPDSMTAVIEEHPDRDLWAEIEPDLHRKSFKAPLPAPVAAFVTRFDGGEFAELDYSRNDWAVA